MPVYPGALPGTGNLWHRKSFLAPEIFLVNGVGETNRLVRAMMLYAPNPLLWSAAVKVVAVMLAIVCWRTGRFRVVDRRAAE